MKFGAWGWTFAFATVLAGCPAQQCTRGTYDETLRRCVGEQCINANSPGCSDSGVASDAADVTSSDVVDAMTPAMEAGPMCASSQQLCGGSCVDTQSSVEHCGSCDPCPAMGGAAASCAMGTCSYACLPGYERVGSTCDVIAPRPIWPPGTSTVTSLRPTFKWSNATGVDGARVQVCRDRECTMVVATIDASGTSARPTADLPTSTVLFWRLQGRVGSAAGMRSSPTWQLRTRAVGAAVDTAHGVDLDINGDGFSDLLFVGPDTARLHLGSALGVSSAASTTVALTTYPSTLLVSLRNVAPAGDVDGDGYGDVLVGDRAATAGAASAAGCAKLYRGSATGLVAPTGSIICGSMTNDAVGTIVAGIGDLDADGFADVAIGAPNASPGGMSGAGQAWVFRGSSTGLLATSSLELQGNSLENIGSAFAESIDLNGDQRSDLVVGLPGASAGGTVAVRYGTTTGVSSAVSITLSGPTSSDLFGGAIASGDFNGDGLGDLAVGLPLGTSAGVGSDAGAVWTYHGALAGLSDTVVSRLRALQNNSFFGHSLQSPGDINRDGLDDLVVGAPTARPATMSNAGSVLVFRGSTAGLAVDSNQSFDGTAAGDNFGYSVGFGGDFNGDGFCDAAAGAPSADPMGVSAAGTVTVLAGASAMMSTSRVFSGSAANSRLGTSIARAPARSVYDHRACLARR